MAAVSTPINEALHQTVTVPSVSTERTRSSKLSGAVQPRPLKLVVGL